MPLPPDILKKRIRNEIKSFRDLTPHDVEIVGELDRFPITLKVTLHQVPGPDLVEGKVRDRTEHIFIMEISEDYPYHKPLVIWGTPIFHPNIMIPEDGGYVCTKLLDEWSFGSNLTAFVKGLEVLVSNPNPRNPYGTDTCTTAAQHFNEHPYRPGGASPAPARRLPRVVGDKE